MSKEILNFWSLICFIIGLLLWTPNIFFGVSSPLWLLNFIIGPIGVALSVLGKNYILTILNFLLTFSFFIFMYLGYKFLGP